MKEDLNGGTSDGLRRAAKVDMDEQKQDLLLQGCCPKCLIDAEAEDSMGVSEFRFPVSQGSFRNPGCILGGVQVLCAPF